MIEFLKYAAQFGRNYFLPWQTYLRGVTYRCAILYCGVDDLVCVQGSATGLQKVADIVSAFCQIFFPELNTTKFRAFAVYWGNDKRPAMTHMKIHANNWTPSIVTMQSDGTMKHLGVLWDMSLHNVQMFKHVQNQLELCLENVIHSKATTGIKLTAVRVTLLNQLIYQTKFST